MSCATIREQVSEYCDGDLAPARQAEVERHLVSCAACRAELESLRALIDRAATMRLDVEPGRDLWPEIESRLRPRTASVLRGPWSRTWPARLAVAAALVAAAVLLMARQPETPSRASLPAASTTELVAHDNAAALAAASEKARVEDGLMQVREDLLRAIAVRRDDLDPATRELVDRNLEIIDQAIGELYQALEQDPENRQLEFLLATTYQREVELLKQINLL